MKPKHAHATGDCSDKSRPDRSMSTNLCVDSWISSVNQSCCPKESRSARTYQCRSRTGQRGAVLIFFSLPFLLSLSLTPSFRVVIYLYFFHLCAHVSIPFSVFPSFLQISLYLLSFSSLSPSPPYILFFITAPLIPPSPFSSLCRWLNHEWCKRCVSFFLPDNVCEPKTPQPSMERERWGVREKDSNDRKKALKRERERKNRKETLRDRESR